MLYRAGCFKVEKRENESSGMELKREYLNYEQLRKQHDMQIISIAMESGIYMSPEQWSQKLYGDSNHKSKMQSIIDKLHSQQTLKKLIQDFFRKIVKFHHESAEGNNNNNPAMHFLQVEHHFQLFMNMEENIFNNISSKSLSTSDSQSTIDDTCSDSESISAGDQSVHSYSNQQQIFYYLPWSYIENTMQACLKILEASFHFNNVIGQSVPTNFLSSFSNTQATGVNMKTQRVGNSSSLQQQLQHHAATSNIELQSRSLSFQQQCITPPKYSNLKQQLPQQQQQQQQLQFQFNKNTNLKKQLPTTAINSPTQQLNQFKKKDNNNSGFARQFPVFVPEQLNYYPHHQQQQPQQQSFFSNTQPSLVAQYNKFPFQNQAFQQNIEQNYELNKNLYNMNNSLQQVLFT